MSGNLPPKVSIVLLNYNGAKDTIDCLKSLNNISYNNYNVVIVDNESTDNSMGLIGDYLLSNDVEYTIFSSPNEAMGSGKLQTKLTLLQVGYNGGYGCGNNVGIKYALKNGADYVLVLNNDTVADPGFLEPMLDSCEEDESIGIASGKIYYLDTPDIFWFNGGSYNACTGKVTHYSWGERDVGQMPLSQTTFVTGGLWLIPKKVFEDVGFINEDYFMYVEDLEFCHRVMAKGYTLNVSMDSRIYHKVGSSSGGEASYFTNYWMTRNKLLFMKENVCFYCIPFFFYNSVVRFTLKWLLTGKYSLLKAQVDAIKDLILKKQI